MSLSLHDLTNLLGHHARSTEERLMDLIRREIHLMAGQTTDKLNELIAGLALLSAQTASNATLGESAVAKIGALEDAIKALPAAADDPAVLAALDSAKATVASLTSGLKATDDALSAASDAAVIPVDDGSGAAPVDPAPTNPPPADPAPTA